MVLFGHPTPVFSTHWEEKPNCAKLGGPNSFQLCASNQLNLCCLPPHFDVFRTIWSSLAIGSKQNGIGWPKKIIRNPSVAMIPLDSLVSNSQDDGSFALVSMVILQRNSPIHGLRKLAL